MRIAGPLLALSGNDGAGLTLAEFKAVIAPIYPTGLLEHNCTTTAQNRYERLRKAAAALDPLCT